MADNPEILIEVKWERFRQRVERYSQRILDGANTRPTSAYEQLRSWDIATGWAVVIVLAGSIWGTRGPLRRIDEFWSRDEQADAVEEWLLDVRCGIPAKLGNELQKTRSVPEGLLQPYEETRSVAAIGRIVTDILTRNSRLNADLREA